MCLKLYSNTILQKKYIEEIYNNINQDNLDKFDFLVLSSHPNETEESSKILEQSKKQKIVFDLADEWHRVPFYYNNLDVKFILKEYAPIEYKNYNKIIPIPTYYNYKVVNQIPIEERKYFLYSNMWLTPSRIKLKQILDRYDDPMYSVTWNSEFAKGISHDKYIEQMKNALVTICPDGYMSPEVTKLGEALMCGNIIICSKKPDYPYYENNSFFVYDSEEEIPNILNYIKNLSTEEKYKIIDKNNLMFNKAYLPKAIANILNQKLQLCVLS